MSCILVPFFVLKLISSKLSLKAIIFFYFDILFVIILFMNKMISISTPKYIMKKSGI